MSEEMNHQGDLVRHSYPIAVETAGFATAVGLLVKTLPYALVRFAILVGASLFTIIWMSITFGGAAWAGGVLHPWVGYGWMFAGMGGFGLLWRLVLRYTLYLVKCGHIAVLTELITRGSINNGNQGMFSYGKQVVVERFGEVNVLFTLDLLIRGVIRAFNKTLDWVGSLIPIPGLDAVMGIVRAIITAATTYIDETIFSYNLARKDPNPWASGRDGLIYYCQNAKEILKTSVWVVVLDKVLTILVWVVMLAPGFLLAAVLPASLKVAGSVSAFVIAILFAANVRGAFLKPIFLIMIMTKFHVTIRNQAINEEWDARLSKISSKFGEIRDRAAAGRPTTPAPPPLPPTP